MPIVNAALPVGAFSWMRPARVTLYGGNPVGEPLFVEIGRLFARVAGRPPWLTEFLRDASEPQILGAVAAGLGPSHRLAAEIRAQLRQQLNALLADEHGVAIGHALELAHILQLAEMPRDSERFARRAMEIVSDRLPKGAGNPFEALARQLLAGALAQQKLWPELLAFEPERNAIILSPQARFVENMRALALMETGKLGEAEAALRTIIEVDASNSGALVNSTAVHLEAGEWSKVIDVAAEAKPLLSGDSLDHLLRNEASAREQIGDSFGAANLLATLSPRAGRSADVAQALARLRRGERTLAITAPDVASAATGGAAPPRGDRGGRGAHAGGSGPACPADAAFGRGRRGHHHGALSRSMRPFGISFPTGRPFPPTAASTRTSTDGSQARFPRPTARVSIALSSRWPDRPETSRTFSTTRQTIGRWQPRYVLLSGIAGGLPREGLRQGDLVVSEQVWHYEHAKIVDGELRPRHRDSFRVDGGLLNSARAFKVASSAWKRCQVRPPKEGHEPKMVTGLFASGEKVIDEIDPPYVQAILRARPDAQAIEMEGACLYGRRAGARRRQGQSDSSWCVAFRTCPPVLQVGAQARLPEPWGSTSSCPGAAPRPPAPARATAGSHTRPPSPRTSLSRG